MRISGKVISRCEKCRRSGISGFASCSHKGKRKYIAEYRIDGERFREVVGFNKAVAEQRLNEIVNSIHTGEFFKSKKPKTTFTDFSQKWLDERVKPRVKGNTYVTYKGYTNNHLIPALGKIDIAKVTEEDLVGLLSTLLDKLGPNTVNKILKVLKNIFKYSKRWKYRDDNPAWDIDTFKEPHREMDYLQPEEIRLLLENSRESHRALFLTAILTGMRSSELLGLQWGDIDWNGDTVHVRRSLRWKKSNEKAEGDNRWWFDSPKTRNSKRAIVISPRLKKALEEHKFQETVRLGQIKKEDRPINPDELVFTNKDGNPVDHVNMVKRAFNPSLEAAGLRRVRFHDLRHTFASILINQGENLKFIQSQLGHASIQTTIDRYGHLMPIKHYSNVGSKMDESVFGSDSLDTYGIHVDNSQQKTVKNKMENKISITN